MITRKLIQQENGDLSVTVPVAVDADFTQPVRMEMTVRIDETPREFGVAL